MKTQNTPDVPFSESYWVIPGEFLAGKHPQNWYFQSSSHLRLQNMLDTGINFFIDLTGEPGYASQLESLDTKQSDKPEYHRFPIIDYSTPDKDLMLEILDTIDNALQAGKKVYVHCQAGLGRTGTVVGCYLVRHGLSGEAALEKIKELRKGLFGISPESDSQRGMVRSWQE